MRNVELKNYDAHQYVLPLCDTLENSGFQVFQVNVVFYKS